MKKIEISEVDATAIRDKIVRIQAIAAMMSEELGQLALMYTLLMPKPGMVLVEGVPASAANAQYVDHAEVLKNARESGVIQELEDRVDQTKNLPVLHGANGILAKYLSPDVMRCGTGSLAVSELLPQHEEDILAVGFEWLLIWPEGFYRNAQTRELQLLIRSEDKNFIFRIDGLPGEMPKVLVFMRDMSFGGDADQVKYRDTVFPHLGEPHPSKPLMAVLAAMANAAEQTLMRLTGTVVNQP